MKIAFLDVASNKIDGYEICSALSTERVSNITLSRFTAPDVLKVPVCAKRLLNEGADAVLVFLNASGEDNPSLELVHEKVIDVELDSSKFVFFSVVYDDEWRSPQQLSEVANNRIAQALEDLFHTVHSTGELAPETQAETPEGSMGMFDAQPPESAAPELPTGGSTVGPSSDSRSLF